MTDIQKGKGIRAPSRKTVMVKEQRDDFARDDIKLAHAGKENRGPAGNQKKAAGKSRSTNVKSRVTDKSRSREIVR